MAGYSYCKGVFCISIDLELAWGVWDNLTPEYVRKCLLLERSIVKRLIELFHRYKISATWAIVGHILKKRDNDSAPEEVNAWYAPDCINQIRNAKPPQEIGSHTFRHICCSDISAEAFSADLEAARKIHEEHGLEFTSFVYPRNIVGHVDVFAKSGIKIFRSIDVGWHTTIGRLDPRINRIANLADKIIPIPPVVVLPIVHENGIIELPSSMLLMGRNGIRNLIHPKVLEMKAKFGLRAAARKRAIFHLWFHPSNFYYKTESQFKVLENIIAYACWLRDKNNINVRTMGKLMNP